MDSIYFSYHRGCPVCLYGDAPAIRNYILQGDNESKYNSQPEYQVQKLIEGWLEEDGTRICPNCSSPDINLFDLKVNQHPLYDFDALTSRCEVMNRSESNDEHLFFMNVYKNGHKLKHDVYFSPGVHRGFIEESVNIWAEEIHLLPERRSISHPNGQLFIATTGGFNFKNGVGYRAQIERLIALGFSKNQVIDIIVDFARNYKLTVTI